LLRVVKLQAPSPGRTRIGVDADTCKSKATVFRDFSYLFDTVGIAVVGEMARESLAT